MIPQAKSKIYLSSERGHTETDWFRSYNTFPFGHYKHPDKTPFGPLYVLNNDTLGGGKKLSLTVEEPTDFFLIPIVGAVVYSDSLGRELRVEVGECLWKSLLSGSTISLQNPYEEDLINFIQAWAKAETVFDASHIARFDIAKNKNQLISISPDSLDDTGNFYIGKFDGRAETIFHIQKNKGLFVYVIEGAFEVQYRLLEMGDGLALWEADEAEIEALSNGAIVLIIELQML